MDTLIPFRSLLFEEMVSTAEMRAVWTEERTVESWMEVEAAITLAQMQLNLIPPEAGERIIEFLTIERFPIARIRERKGVHGHLMVAFLKAFREACGPAAEHFHLGPTTQDILDTGLTVQLREANDVIVDQLRTLEDVLCEQALRYKRTVMMGRTHQQHAVPMTLGFTLAVWASEMRDHLERLRQGEGRWLYGSIAGAVGTQSAFVELAGVDGAQEIEAIVCRALGLRRPTIALHSRTDRFAEVGWILSAICSSLGKMGMSIANLQRSEVMEVEEPHNDDRYGSSTMPNKINPEPSEQVDGLAKLVRAQAMALQDILMQDQRDSTRMPVQFTALPTCYLMTSRALATITAVIRDLVVHEDQMLKNLKHPNVLGQAVAERLMIRIYQKTGKRDWAHTKLHEWARRCRSERRWFREVVSSEKALGRLFTQDELDEIFDLQTYIGTAAQQVEEMVEELSGSTPEGVIRLMRTA